MSRHPRLIALITFARLSYPILAVDDAQVVGSPPNAGQVQVEILERADQLAKPTADEKPPAPKDPSWSELPDARTDSFAQSAFALVELPRKYNERGIMMDRTQPFLVRMSGKVTLAPGEHRLLLRALGTARLMVDGKEIAQTKRRFKEGPDNRPVPDQEAEMVVAENHLLPPGHMEVPATISGDGADHVITVEVFVGGKEIRPEIGELTVARSLDGSAFTILGTDIPFTDPAWFALAQAERDRVAALNADRRRSPEEDSYWRLRHDLARQQAAPAPPLPEVKAEPAPQNPVDLFIQARLETANMKPAPITSDAAFLRRVTLDTIGLIPTEEEVRTFLADPSPDKRDWAVDRLLRDPRWADRWVSYWQDVLAENPNMVKGTLNNTGPFRWWLHEALLDNLPMDRFATALILMDGSEQYGGPAGFRVATQNDLPLAAKAQIISSAFLAMQMKCARCHDAPNHPFDQGDLFSLAAMLQRQPLTVPETSLTKGLTTNSHVTVSLKAGEKLDPHWPLAGFPVEPLPGVMRDTTDSRERMAAILTDARNDRFAEVLANRLWRELMGFGIVDPVGDWEEQAPSHRELLSWLAHELVTHDYDLKHLARLIFTSAAYQRMPTPEGSRAASSVERLFASPARRRMSAEQLVDSLFLATGETFDCEPMTMDPEGVQPGKNLGNLGVPERAWEFAALSNERDRPALAKPRAQVITDVLSAFGWRESRAEPRTVRDQSANVLQPALLANGAMSTRLTRLTETNAFTTLALTDQPLDELITRLFARLLSRPPNLDETERFTRLLEPGYEQRRTGAPPAPKPPRLTRAVSWSNHLNPDATTIIVGLEKNVKTGPPPTPQLESDWRERMEDAIWALMLSPEFIHLP